MRVSPWLRYHARNQVYRTLGEALNAIVRGRMGIPVYLCGGINGLTDGQCSSWRDRARAYLHPVAYPTVDPMARDYRGHEDDAFREIVEGDIADIEACATLLVNASRPSWGTAMEVRAAFVLGKDIVAFMEEE